MKVGKLYRGGRESDVLNSTGDDVTLSVCGEEIRLRFFQGGPQRGTRFAIYIGRTDFHKIIRAMVEAQSLPVVLAEFAEAMDSGARGA